MGVDSAVCAGVPGGFLENGRGIAEVVQRSAGLERAGDRCRSS